MRGVEMVRGVRDESSIESSRSSLGEDGRGHDRGEEDTAGVNPDATEGEKEEEEEEEEEDSQ